MANVKFILFSIITLAIIGLVGYWAVLSIEPGDIHATRQKEKALEEENQTLKDQVLKLQDQLAAIQPPAPTPTPVVAPTPAPAPTPSPTPAKTTTTYKYQSLINDLQKLITDKVVMKEKSQGTRVGTLQTFFNIYNKTSNKVDNDFGKSTTANVIAFQKAVGLKADGQTGPTTYQKMIDWLKKQG
ncbi:MAG: peptidoglycan-binding protein [Patescibacteria group bacterium]